MTVADRIKNTRESLGWSQEYLAKRCGYAGRSAISKIELSGDNVTSKKVQKIADALNVNASYLMGWEENTDSNSFKKKTKNQIISEFVNNIMEESDDSIKKQLIESLVTLDQSDWEKIMKFIELLKK